MTRRMREEDRKPSQVLRLTTTDENSLSSWLVPHIKFAISSRQINFRLFDYVASRKYSYIPSRMNVYLSFAVLWETNSFQVLLTLDVIPFDYSVHCILEFIFVKEQTGTIPVRSDDQCSRRRTCKMILRSGVHFDLAFSRTICAWREIAWGGRRRTIFVRHCDRPHIGALQVENIAVGYVSISSWLSPAKSSLSGWTHIAGLHPRSIIAPASLLSLHSAFVGLRY